ncbi:xanthine dehydrogenase family protein subunit M, partial [Chloroflexota bacterium]
TFGTAKVFKDIKIVLGAVAPTPVRAHSAEEIIRGSRVDEKVIEKCAQAASDEARPRASSFRASPSYKKKIVKLFTMRAIKQLMRG